MALAALTYTVLTRIRRTIRHIRYHSAYRERTVWDRAWDWLMLAMLVLAPLAAAASHAMVLGVDVVRQEPGRFVQRGDGRLMAVMLGESGDRGQVAAERQAASQEVVQGGAGATHFGSFSVLVEREVRGWPLTLSSGTPPAKANLDLMTDRQPREGVRVARDEPVWAAIDEALVARGDAELIEAWRRDAAQREHKPWAWFFASVIWLCMLLVAGRIGLFFTWFITGLATDRAGRLARLRLKKGLCEHCGYDLKGNAWAAQCPECGEET